MRTCEDGQEREKKDWALKSEMKGASKRKRNKWVRGCEGFSPKLPRAPEQVHALTDSFSG